MTRQETLNTINDLLPRQSQEGLEALLGWLKQDNNNFGRKLKTDVNGGKFDQLVNRIIAEDGAEETIDLESEYTLEQLLEGVTDENIHPEIVF
jgi:hypothetical protein